MVVALSPGPWVGSGRELLANLLGGGEVIDGVIREALNEEAEALDLHPGLAHIDNCVTGVEGLSLEGHCFEVLSVGSVPASR